MDSELWNLVIPPLVMQHLNKRKSIHLSDASLVAITSILFIKNWDFALSDLLAAPSSGPLFNPLCAGNVPRKRVASFTGEI